MSPSSFLKWYAASLLAGALAVAGFNAFVDPYGIHRFAAVAGMNREKYEQGSCFAKAAEIAAGGYDAVILGNSRTTIGISPTHRAWEGFRTYNLATFGDMIRSTGAEFRFASRTNRLRRVLFAADFDMFIAPDVAGPDFSLSPFNEGRDPLRAFLAHTWSLSALRLSFRTLNRNLKWEPSGYVAGAWDDRLAFESEDAARVGHRYLFDHVLEKNMLIREIYYAGAGYDRAALDDVRGMVDECRRREIDLRIFISPVHARQLEAIRDAGLWDEFESWKRDLARAAAGTGAGPAFPIYDFTGYSGFVAEPVPPAGDTATRMKRFWESSHYTKALGDKVLERIYAVPTAPGGIVVGAGFGDLLTADNVDRHLEEIRRQREAYAREQPFEVAEVARLAEKTRPEREAVRRRLRGTR